MASAIELVKICMSPPLSWCAATTLTSLVAALSLIDISTWCLILAAESVRKRRAIPWSLISTVTARSLYAVTVDWAMGARMPCGAGGGDGEPLAATCAQVAVALPPLKLDIFSGIVPSPTEVLITVISLWMFCAHLAAS